MGERTIPSEALRWVAGNHVGLSSMAIWSNMAGVEPKRGWANPWDPDDLSRCLRLLKEVPQWADRLPEMAKRSPEWAALIEDWDEIVSCMEMEVGWDWSKGRSAPKTYALIKSSLAKASPHV